MTQIKVSTKRRTELVPITYRVQEAVLESKIEHGVCYVYVPHTTAGVTINENADPMVAHDILHVVDRIIPFNDNGYRHMEGNSAAHVKACLFGSLETVFIRNGRLVLGTWQGIFFCEFDGPRDRKVQIKLIEG